MKLPLALLLLALWAAGADAQSYDFVVDQAATQSDLALQLDLDLTGDLIGDWDAATNPTGTQTVPGLFGGSGNNLIPVTMGVGTDTLFSGSSSGGFGLGIDVPSSSLELSDLDLDLLAGGSTTTTLSISLLYSTFRTVQPSSLFPGGVPITLPVGSASVGNLHLVQSGPSTNGVLVPLITPGGGYACGVLVPAELSFDLDFQGQTTPVGPVPVGLPLRGELHLGAIGAQLSLGLDQNAQQTVQDPLPGFALTDLPFDLPTILPPGGTAHLLFNATIDSLDAVFDLEVDLRANGTQLCGYDDYCGTNPNSTGLAAQLVASGSLLVGDNNLQLDVVDLPPNTFGIFYMSQNQASLAFPSGEGVLCVTDPVVRFPADIQNSGPAGMVGFSPDLANLPQGVVFQPGETWNFQFWFRDVNPGPTSNTSNGVAITFCR